MKKSKWFIVFAFILGWGTQIVASFFAYQGDQTLYQLFTVVTMFAPLTALLITRNGFSGMGIKPELKGKIRWVLVAWFLPAILTILGAVLYYLIFPSHFDPDGSYIAAILGSENMALLEEQNISINMYAVTQIISALLYAPLINMFISAGEEVGWRGYLYPNLKEELGVVRGRIVGGVIWGIWHWPLIALVGYEYGTSYIGFPYTGMLVFVVFTTIFGYFLDILYEKTKTIWVPSIAHGALNAIAAAPLFYFSTSKLNYMILGPIPNSLISLIPTLLAVILLSKSEAKGAM